MKPTNKTRNSSKLNQLKPQTLRKIVIMIQQEEDTGGGGGGKLKRKDVKQLETGHVVSWKLNSASETNSCCRSTSSEARESARCVLCVGGSKAPTVHANYFICGSQTGSHRWDFTDAETNRIVTDGMNHIFWRILISFFFVKFAGQCKTSESSQQTLAESFWVFSCCFHLIIWCFSNQTAKTKRHKMF